MNYKIKLEIFEGPLDLLLYLIKKDHLNIYDIPIAQVTTQYMQYLELMQLLDLDIAGEFLVIAATLMQIKSKILLPVDEIITEQQEEDDPKEELLKKLLEYKKFKQAAVFFESKENVQRNIFKRPNSHFEAQGKEEVFFETNLFDLLNAFSKALKNMPKDVFREVLRDEFSIEGKIHDLLHILLKKIKISLDELFRAAKNKTEIIATFLAVLELIRQKEIIITQTGLFKEIFVMLNQERITAPLFLSANMGS
ncbi:MAG: hypothetical protein DRP78_05670 [Candidatus Omnitrophota bacterium]|nr:MAG: hypothetical protein DRP78_05670 [Candidatus Omnitrophota bacterium]